MKFLRKGALLLAVLAMVLGQCFGMLGGVAAQAADDYDDLVVTGITVSDAPTQVMVRGKVTANVQITLKNVGDTAIAAEEDVSLTSKNIVKVYEAYTGQETAIRLATGSGTFVKGVLAEVDLPEIAAGKTVTVDATLTITGEAVNEPNYKVNVLLVGKIKGEAQYEPKSGYNTGETIGSIPQQYKNASFPIEIVSKPTADFTKPAAGLDIYALDEQTGEKLSKPTYQFGDKMGNIVVACLDKDDEVLGYAKTVTVKNLTTGKTVENWEIEAEKFYEGTNHLQVIYTGADSKRVSNTITVYVELADPTIKVDFKVWGTNAYNQTTAADAPARVKLTATVDLNGVADFTLYSKKNKPDEGSVIFYDGDKVLATVEVGTVQDDVPVSGGYSPVETVGGNNEAIYAFVAAEGEHEFTAKYVPAGDMTQWFNEATTEDAKELTVGTPEGVYNYATLTFEDSILRKGSTDVTLSFDAPVSAGEATVTFTKETTDGTTDKVNVVFDLNDTDTEYTKSITLYYTGVWDASLDVNFDEKTELSVKDEAPVKEVTKQEKIFFKAKSITVFEAATVIDLTASATSGEVGDKIDLTATVTSAGKAVDAGKVAFTVIYDDEDDPAQELTPIAVEDGEAKTTLKLAADMLGVYAVYKPADNKYDYAASKSDTVDLTVANVAGSLEITGPTDPVAADGKAAFTVKIMDANGDWDVTSSGGKVTAVTVGTEKYSFNRAISMGQAKVSISVDKLDAGEHTAVVTVVDPEYGTLTGSVTFTVAEPELIATSLVLDDDNLEPKAALTDVINSEEAITVTVKDAYGLGDYAATGTVELYLGDVLVATATLKNGVATFNSVKALTAGEDLVLTAKYLGSKTYAASQVTGDEKIDVTKLTSEMLVAVDGNELTITLNVPAGYTPNGKLAITSGETTLATIDAVKAENVVTVANPALAGEQDVTVAFTGDSGMTDATKTVKVTFEAVSGWYENPKGTWYYFKEGEMLANEWVQDGFWYYLGADGVMVKGWKQLEWNGVTDWYYFKTYAPNSGSMMTGWQFLGGKWYYMASSGKMLTGWQQLGGKWYYLDPVNGDMETGWQQLGGKWYYMDPTNGDMKTGWQKVGNTWYYMNASGAMVTGWQRLSWNGVTNWYYFQSSGAMATSGTIDGWNIASSGIATPAN